MQNKIKSSWFWFENLIIYLPFFIVFFVIFNIPDSKYLASRFTLLSALYCAVRFYPAWIGDFLNKKNIVIFTLIFLSYFIFMKYYNEGNSDFSRAIFHSLLYFIFFPFNRFSRNFIFYLLVISSLFIGVASYYQVYCAGMSRAGYLSINPIPFSYFSGLCLILIVYFCLSNKNKNMTVFILTGIGILSSIYAIILAQTRATFLALLVVFVLVSLSSLMKSASKVKSFRLLSLYFVMSIVLWNIPIIKQRVSDAVNQVHNYENNYYKSSTGIRVKLWESGLLIASENISLGSNRSDVRDFSLLNIKEGTIPEYLRDFLIHPNPNFHNQYIQALVDSGLIGLTLILVFVLSPLLLLKAEEFYSKLMGVSISVFTVICLWFDSLFLYNHTVILYSLVFFIVFGVRRYEKEEL
ncbi:O-antigen ligase family protein [Vibrio mimicus]|uniref:O-antigen ligase family protein n=1 Tax=Vibrio mimicus TaxID=674 RepID=UPI0011D3919E|nr:O-antigen ligase family protein [Vibrio mimicus]TXY30879.1 O-antigen ligase family protein [Vibrio mimicus]